MRSILTVNKDTVYGKEHHFEEILKAKTAEELFKLYDENVPINQYTDLEKYIERHKNGEENVLFPGKPLMYLTTSGTTNTPKWIPINQKQYQDVIGKMNKLWFHLTLKHRPKACDGKTISIVGKVIEGKAPDGTLYGSISGLSQRDIPDFMKEIYSAPSEIFHISDYKARYYALMRMGIMQNVTWIVSVNPSTLIEMQNNANEYYEDYVNDVENGTISDKFDIPEYIRTALLKEIKPKPERAAELRALKEKYGRVLPKHYWPNLQVISLWLCGNTDVYFQKVKDSFPEQTLFFEFSYFSSEFRSGNVIHPETKSTVLFCHKVFFEFIKEEDIDLENPRIYQTHEVEVGKRYSILASTYAGLYRYNMNDLVTITGKYKDYPTIQFSQKINGIISLTGEKISEIQYIESIRMAEKEFDVKLVFYIAFADVQNSLYHFYYELPKDSTLTVEDMEKFTKRVDELLKEKNPEYRDKRGTNRLKDPKTYLLGELSFERFKEKCIALGFRDGQFKLNLLQQDDKKHEMFKELVNK